VVQSTLAEINNCLILKRQLDGIAFYEFYKSGGLSNLFEIFRWLSTLLQKIDQEWQQVFHYLFEDSCNKIKDILISILLLQKID
jgi:hypothetical protein